MSQSRRSRKERDRIQELAKHAQGRPSTVNSGMYGGLPVSKSGSDVFHKGDRIAVVDGMVFKNGTYHGSAPS